MTRCKLCNWRGPSDLAAEHLIKRHLASPEALDEHARRLISERVAACLSAGRSGPPRSPAIEAAVVEGSTSPGLTAVSTLDGEG